ncbi:MAG: hypothetical protein M3Z17_05535 [Gemmatimonadota bacterium]|nr:hypothetical protein [Gemmatimonadota bacterium]
MKHPPAYIWRMDPVSILTAGLVDYAGLFPPAGLPMRAALENYASYFNRADAASLGRFIVAVERIDELEVAASDLFPPTGDARPWKISVLANADVESVLARVQAFNAEHQSADGNEAIVDALEIKFDLLGELEASDIFRTHSLNVFVELPLDDELENRIAAIHMAGAFAKVRTGGVTPTAFPAGADVVRFLRECCRAGVAFKATAGLHHPLRGTYPLTYEEGCGSAAMFGFLNVFLGAALMWAGADDAVVSRLIDETDPDSLSFGDDAITWREEVITAGTIQQARRYFATSFGSCSFREPVDELKSLMSAAHR